MNLEEEEVIQKQLKYDFKDTLFSMIIGWAINSAMILMAAATFYRKGEGAVNDLSVAGNMLTPLLGKGASVIFALALLLAGLSSSITAGMAGGTIFSGIFNKPYDIALSFAGENRDLAQALFDKLVTREISVFYDQNEQHRILAENVEDYLAPIYRSEAEYVVVLLSTHYPKKIWTKFESDQFKARFGENKIIPIWYSDTDVSIFDETRKYGGYQFDVSPGQFEAETNKIVELIAKKIEETRV